MISGLEELNQANALVEEYKGELPLFYDLDAS